LNWFCGLYASAALLLAGAPALQLNVFYECAGQRIKVLNCAGPGDAADCEVRSYTTLPRGRGSVTVERSTPTRGALLTLLKACRPQASMMPAGQVRKEAASIPAGQPPKPGLTSCAGKLDGTYQSPSGFPSIVFRSGKASVEGDEAVECWTGGGKIYLHTPGTPADHDFVMGINSNGTLDTALGEMKKKNN